MQTIQVAPALMVMGAQRRGLLAQPEAGAGLRKCRCIQLSLGQGPTGQLARAVQIFLVHGARERQSIQNLKSQMSFVSPDYAAEAFGVGTGSDWLHPVSEVRPDALDIV